LNHDYELTIFCLKINEEQRIILTIDNAPTFGCIVITLFRLVNSEAGQQAYSAIAEFIYQYFTV
jgi:hypothetical protein